MSIASEITRIQNAKSALKTAINSKTDENHQITDETIDDYADFVNSISTGGTSSIDWITIGYNSTPQSVTEGFNYAKEIYDNWENVTSLANKFISDSNLRYFPSVNTSNSTSFAGMFKSCFKLSDVPILNTTSVTNNLGLFNMFSNCTNLTTESIDNILQMCINATAYGGTKTLATLGFTSTNYPSSIIQALPHYQSFLNAGWTIGY